MLCSRCGAKIDKEKVFFSHGTGDKAMLYSRVCRHAIKAGRGEGCINDCRVYSQDKDYGFMPTDLDHNAIAKELLESLPISQKP